MPQFFMHKESDLSALTLPESSPIVRQRPRPAPLRQNSYDEEFDFHTLVYDCFFLEEANIIRIMGPALLNFEAIFQTAPVKLIDQNGSALDKVTQNLQLFNKFYRLDISYPEGFQPTALHIDLGILGSYTLNIQPNGADIFRGKNVCFTLFKFEPLEWLAEWVEFNIHYHGATSFIIYHNNSVYASTQEIYEYLCKIPGIETLLVSNWPFKYGPSAAGTGMWDSVFAQQGFFDQIRYRYLSQAKAVLKSDIDELIITADHQSIFTHFEKQKNASLLINGVNISSNDNLSKNIPYSSRRHRMYHYTAPSPKGVEVGPKWICQPKALEEKNLMLPHRITEIEMPVLAGKLCHFRDINTLWKHSSMPALNAPKLDLDLVSAFRKIGWISERKIA